MPLVSKRRRFKRLLIIAGSILFFLFILLLIFVDRFVEPILRDRLHTLIIQGSDSLYTYQLGRLKANFFGGNVEVENLQIKVDSARYEYLSERNALPSLTMQVSLGRGRIKGVGVISLLFGKKIRVEEILSKDADIKLSRHVHQHEEVKVRQPLWKAIRPKIQSISIGSIRLEGIKMSYKNADSSESVRLKFDRCDAVFKDILVDSSSAVDTTRIGFTKTISLKFSDLKFRTNDSTYKMKAKLITYSSVERSLEVDSFKLQPTLEKEDLYKTIGHQQSIYYISFEKVRFVNTRLDHFIYNNIIDADSLVFERPEISIYNDRSLAQNYTSKIGRYPHQELLKASSKVIVKTLAVRNASLTYTEKDPKTYQEGVFMLSRINMTATNLTNDSLRIRQNHILIAKIDGAILGTGSVNALFRLYLDSADGRYDASGTIKNVSSSQLNPLAVPLANVQFNSFDLQNLTFQVRGSDFDATGNVQMRYNNLSLTVRKTDDETGTVTTKKFLTKVLNKFVLRPENPGPDGIERTAVNIKVARLTTEAFFGLLWKTIFAGMQSIMMRSGKVE